MISGIILLREVPSTVVGRTVTQWSGEPVARHTEAA
jgi:hypothetical protein